MSVNPRVGISEIEKLRAYNNMQFVTVNYELSPHQAIGLDVEITALEAELAAARKSAAKLLKMCKTIEWYGNKYDAQWIWFDDLVETITEVGEIPTSSTESEAQP